MTFCQPCYRFDTSRCLVSILHETETYELNFAFFHFFLLKKCLKRLGSMKGLHHLVDIIQRSELNLEKLCEKIPTKSWTWIYCDAFIVFVDVRPWHQQSLFYLYFDLHKSMVIEVNKNSVFGVRNSVEIFWQKYRIFIENKIICNSNWPIVKLCCILGCICWFESKDPTCKKKFSQLYQLGASTKFEKITIFEWI